MTFVSTAHAVSYCGALPVFVDIRRDTLTIDIEDMKRKATGKTKAVIPVHYGGHPCEMKAIHKWARTNRHRIMIIEDAAHACGSEYRGQRIGSCSQSDAACFSFHAVKNLATGDGGMVTTNDAGVAEKLCRLRWCGITKSTWDRTMEGLRYGWYYEVPELGFKCHMNDIQAALGLVQLGRLDVANSRRRQLAEWYTEELAELDWIETPVEYEYALSAWHNYVIKTPHRDELHVYLKERGVSTGVHYMPIHLQPYYYDPAVRLPIAEAVWKELLTLPLYPDLTYDEQRDIIHCIRQFGREHDYN
jgi:perosamine synthetase